MADRSRCGAVRIFYVANEPSAGIVRVGSLSLWRRANFLRGRRTLCGDRACRSALAVAPANLHAGRRTLCADCACRIAPADEPSAGIVRVGSLSLWRRANLQLRRRTLCGDRACRIALAVAEATAKLFELLEGAEGGRDPVGKAIAKLADGTSRLLAAAVAAAELRAALSDVKGWAQNVPRPDQQAPKIRTLCGDRACWIVNVLLVPSLNRRCFCVSLLK